jgi:hypothetical protein
VPRSRLNPLSSRAYGLGRLLRDLNAVDRAIKQGSLRPVVNRIENKLLGRLAGKILGRLWRR